MDSDDQLFDKIFEFKMMAKQFSKESAKAAAKQKTLMGKIKNVDWEEQHGASQVLRAGGFALQSRHTKVQNA